MHHDGVEIPKPEIPKEFRNPQRNSKIPKDEFSKRLRPRPLVLEVGIFFGISGFEISLGFGI
jgi:hypothetical protein